MTFQNRNPAIKRLMREAEELSEPTELYYAHPLDDNIFEWHFTIRGPADTDFEGGIYHGRILLPAEYPMKPPSIIMLTNNGRFKVHEKICLSISGHHPETWLPSWSIRTALLALIGFMPTLGEGAIGSLDYTTEERKVLAKKSTQFVCQVCKSINENILPSLTNKSEEISAEAKELASHIEFKNSTKSKPKEDLDIKSEKIESSDEDGLRKRQTINSESSVNRVEMSSSHSVNPTTSSDGSQETSLRSFLIIVLSVFFFFLLSRRIYLVSE